MQIGLFFGSFNPIHQGHLMLANYMLEYAGLQEVWFIVSPQNPLKDKKNLLAEQDRFDMVTKAIDEFPGFRAIDIEFHMPKPSYTIDTLVRLTERHPSHNFYLICGMDALQSFHKWKNYNQILDSCNILVYPRKDADGGQFSNHPSVKIVDAPQLEVSSSFIRKAISESKNVQFFLPHGVYQYIILKRFYL